ncbi:hypothetical protein BH23CHL2_BH23CHL2_29590 [soil metagenome]
MPDDRAKQLSIDMIDLTTSTQAKQEVNQRVADEINRPGPATGQQVGCAQGRWSVAGGQLPACVKIAFAASFE